MKHLEQAEEQHSLLKLVKGHEKDIIIRLGKESYSTKKAFQSTVNVKEQTKKELEERWKSKVTDGYLQKALSVDEDIDMQKTNNWVEFHQPPHTEGYITTSLAVSTTPSCLLC